jgi:hypothetical protein
VDRFFDWLSLALVVGIVLLFTRPGSLGPQLVNIGGGKIVDLVRTVTGGGTWNG